MVRRLRRSARWLATTVVGFGLLIVGVVLLVGPGPGLLLLAAGLGILSLEFAWARRLREQLTERFAAAGRSIADRNRRAEVRVLHVDEDEQDDADEAISSTG